MAMNATGHRAYAIPDAAHWASFGVDLCESGFNPVAAVTQADVLLVAERLPDSLSAALAELRPAFEGRLRVLGGSRLGGRPVEELGDRPPPASGQEPEPVEEEGDDAGASSDGLAMESLADRIGPISAALPSGLVLHLTLAGDVVTRARVNPTLVGDERTPDPLATAAWRWALERREGNLDPTAVAGHLVETELERALSHTSWLASFAGLLGWAQLAEMARRAVSGLIAVRHAPADGAAQGVPRLAGRLGEIHRLLGSRRLAMRTRGLAELDGERARSAGLRGPLARAAGVETDARSEDPAYRELGFEPLVGERGDALGRARLRSEEAVRSLELAVRAREAGALPAGSGAEVEGPRGPVGFKGARRQATGAEEARALAGEMAQGKELARALVTVASFDLSPWTVDR